MKTAVLALLLAPSAFAGVVARVALPAGSAAVPMLLQSPAMTGAPSLQLLPAPSLAPSLAVMAPVLAAPSVAPALAAAIVPTAIVPTAVSPLAAAKPLALEALKAPAAASAPQDGPSVQFDGAANRDSGAQLVDPNFGPYRRLSWNEQNKLDTTVRYAHNGSQVFAALNGEFANQGGYYLLDSNPNAKYMAAAAMDQNRRPVIILTHDLLNRYQGRSEDSYRGAPWEFIASVIAREQVFFNAWYSVIPAAAEKLAISYMNMTRVFVDLTNGTSRSWATDKDYQAVSGDRSTYTQWNWFEQLVAAARSAARGVGTNSGHLIESKFFSWIRDWTAGQDKASIPAFQYSLWEQYDGRYYRPGDAKNGQPLPPGAPRIDKATYDRAAGTAYGTDGKGTPDQNNAYGWIIAWLKARFEI